MHQILEYALKNKENKTRFTLIFANVTEKDILLKEQFDEWEKKLARKARRADFEFNSEYFHSVSGGFGRVMLMSS